MHKIFNRPFKGITLDRLVTNPNIRVGRYSYYSGYYHGPSLSEGGSPKTRLKRSSNFNGGTGVTMF